MSLSKEALQLIIDNAILAADNLPDTDSPVAYLPEGTTVVDMERYQAARSRFRGALTTASLADFAGYVLDRRGEENPAKGFVDQDAMRCVVFFNLGNELIPGHADDTATLTLKPTAAYRALQAIAGEQLSQKALAEWMEDWHANLMAESEAGETMSTVQAIAAVRNITIKAASERTHVEANFAAQRSAMDAIEAKSQETLPGALHFTCIPYEGLGQRVITLRLSILTGGDKPALKPRWVGEEQTREEIAHEFKAVLATEIGDAATLTLGIFNPGK
ncbi:DUF2303 family protein [Azotobacter beijerinckii]|uniref:Uncharacterized conserved protein YfdQ, DUF2303 family n=1 Tax=Azotobacter beijerinckii TaxID=170623 RepID=A0A1I3ZNL5_9GAMM|nr:DUF2303 family protein [Azotobacter beijerinckii]SFK45734.1 Uncharacterized conserved protein YfdQ, DUF2303 family [Azotobacter beijerinckii]